MRISHMRCKSSCHRVSPLSSLPPSLTIPKACVNVEDVVKLLFRWDAPYIAYTLLISILAMLQESEYSLILRRTLGTGCTASCILKIITRKTPVNRKKKTTKRSRKRAMKSGKKRTSKRKRKRKETRIFQWFV